MTTTETNGHHATNGVVPGAAYLPQQPHDARQPPFPQFNGGAQQFDGGAGQGRGTDGRFAGHDQQYVPVRQASGGQVAVGPQQGGGHGQPQPRQATPSSALLFGIPDPAELDKAIAHANEVAAKQGAGALSGAMTWEEHQDKRQRAEALRLHRRQVDEQIELARIALDQELAEVELAASKAEIEAKAEEARIRHAAALKRIRHAAEIEGIQQDDEFAAEKQEAELRGKDAKASAEARERLREHTDPTKKLAVQARRRTLTVRGFVAVAGIAVIGGGYNVSDSFGRLLEIQAWTPGRFALGILEPLATIPLALILLARMSLVVTEGSRARQQAAEAVNKTSDWVRRRFADTEWRYEVLFLAVAVVLNVLPHALLGEFEAMPLWLWVPCALACALRLGGHLVRKYDDAMLDLVLDAQLSAPVGNLAPEIAKLFRQCREIAQRRANGTLRGELQSNGLPSLSGVVKTLKDIQPTAPVREGQAVIAGMSILDGIVK